MIHNIKSYFTDYFYNKSIREKLIIIIMGITFMALFLANGINTTLQYINMRDDAVQTLALDTKVFAKNIASSLDFQDRERAADALSVFGSNTNITNLCLYDAQKYLFGSYRETGQTCPPQFPTNHIENHFDIIHHVEPSMVGNTNVGHVYASYSLKDKHLSFLKQNAIYIGFTLLALAVAYIIANFFQKFISGPIVVLAREVGHITDKGKYTSALTKTSNDETGRLIDAFNSMIVSIHTNEKRLIESIERADSANRLKGDFLAMMSHEIRTPMNGIIGMTELLLDTKLSHKQKNYAHTVIRSAESLLGIINDILDFSKIEAGKLDLEPLPMDLMEVVEDTANLLALKAREKAVELIVRYVPDTPRYVIGDAGRIRQVISNLINNAVKFTHKGYVLVTVESDDDERVKISVKDTGIGIPPEKHVFLFQKFSQADTSTTRQYGGTGLGLAISQQLVELMNGQIGFESQKDKGSTFWFTAHLPPDTNKGSIAPPAPINIQNVRILVVDDITVNGQLMDERLSLMGMRPTYMRNSQNVIETLNDAVLADDPYQMAILDYLMPGTNGEDLAKQIKSDPILKDIALIMLSSAGGRGYSKRFKDAGFSSYLSKPIRAQELEETLSLVWREYNAGNRGIIMDASPSYAADNKPDITSIQFNAPRILLAEDNRTNQAFVQEILEQANCVVDIAANGKEAIKKIANTSYDLIFMDCEMPEMDGFEATTLLTQMKADNIIKDLPIIALTANAEMSDRQLCLDVGMVDYLSKPLRKNDLLELTKKWLGQHVKIINEKTDYRFDGYTVLLVEDNRTNQMLAEEILNDLGFDVIHAANGQIAVDIVTTRKFDLILMDCQMPVMDGFEATRRIKAMPAYTDIPIIALTANAMKGDREQCLDVGMVDYLSKPLRKNTLVSTLSKWVTPHSSQINELGDDIIQYLDSPILDEDILNSYQTVMGAKFTQQAETFLHDARMMVMTIMAAFDARDVETIHRQSHQLKSTSAMMGAMELSAICAVIESQAFEFIQYQKGDDQVLDGRFITVIQTVFKRVAPLLDAYIQTKK